MSVAENNSAGKTPEVRERKIVFLLCLLAAVHVFIFSAAFPFFSVVDEQVHFDLAVRYSQGNLPRSLTPPCDEALPYIVIFSTPEFLWAPTSQPGGVIPPPPWKQPVETVRETLLAKQAGNREKFKNYEAASPPLYYSLAGAWWRLGKWLKLDGGQLLYWLRFLNVPLVSALVWLGWRTAQKLFPENNFIRLAVPGIIAFLPQTMFYAINNDILAPLTFGVAFVLLLKVWEAHHLTPRLAAATGLALAAVFLTKISNLPLLAVAGVFLALKFLLPARREDYRAVKFPLLVLLVSAGLPMAAWMAWCKINFGDFTGSNLKIQFLGWTHKPFAEWFQHPIFSPSGLWFFLNRNLATFWQGEPLWHRQPLANPAVDVVYTMLSLGTLALTLVALLRRPPQFAAPQRTAIWLSFAFVAAAFAFFALLSVKYDFQDCFYPSRARPFFVSGRLMLGMLIPFLILFACGLDRLLKNFKERTKFFVLLVSLAFMLATETAIDWPIFPNSYNWFHM